MRGLLLLYSSLLAAKISWHFHANYAFYLYFLVIYAFSVFLLIYPYIILYICVANDILQEISKTQKSAETPQKLDRHI
jgi:hypothetical protein